MERVAENVRKLALLEEETPNVYRADHLSAGRPRSQNAYGGLLFAQSLLAAQKTVDDKFIPHALHSFFILNVAVGRPVIYRVQRTRDGRSFCTRLVQAEQDGAIVFVSQISFCVAEPTTIEHQAAMPSVPQPEELLDTHHAASKFVEQIKKGDLVLLPHIHKELMRKVEPDEDYLFEDKSINGTEGTFNNDPTFQFRPTEPKKYFGIEPFNPEPINHWVKFRGSPLTDDRLVHRFLIAFMTDATLVGVANRPHYRHAFHPIDYCIKGYVPSMLFSLDHSVHFHDDDFRADDWMLYENWSPVARNGRAFSEGRLWSRDGRLILSVNQESLSRTRTAPSRL
ncbi:Protein F25E2.3 [Aphelenchoides avenae]|nr:Protein F25E2.3 [Aphelenchus avenae]